jgi:hypothetical protein
MASRKHWLSTDEYTDTESSLRKAAQLVSAVENDTSEWKWLLIAIHSATQGMFVLSLSRGNRLPTLKPSQAAAWLKAYQTGPPWPAKMDLDYFPELYKKSKNLLPAAGDSGGEWFVSAAHDKAIRLLNDLRNGFIHFGAQGWTIDLAGLPSVCLRCLEIADYLGWEAGQVLWRSDAQSKRVRRYLNSLQQALSRLDGKRS